MLQLLSVIQQQNTQPPQWSHGACCQLQKDLEKAEQQDSTESRTLLHVLIKEGAAQTEITQEPEYTHTVSNHNDPRDGCSFMYISSLLRRGRSF